VIHSTPRTRPRPTTRNGQVVQGVAVDGVIMIGIASLTLLVSSRIEWPGVHWLSGLGVVEVAFEHQREGTSSFETGFEVG